MQGGFHVFVSVTGDSSTLKRSAVRSRFARQRSLWGVHVVNQELLTVRDVAAALKISPRQVWKLNSMGRLPAPLRLSRSVRWSAELISKWVRLGCPPRDRFYAH